MNLKPLATNVLIEPVKIEETTKSGIVLGDAARKKTSQGKVIAVGDEVTGLKADDEIIFREYGPEKVRVGEQELLVCDEKDVIAILCN